MNTLKKALALLASAFLILTGILPDAVSARESGTIIDVTEYGADPSGASDSAIGIQKAIEAARAVSGPVTLNFPKGTYNIYPDKSVHREQYISNTVGTNGSWSTKIIGILLKDLDDLTLEGNGSLFQFHGRMTTIMTENCTNLTMQNFDVDWQVPPTVDVTVVQTEGNDAVLYIPESQPYKVENNHIVWTSELSPYTGEPYWSGQDFINGYAQIADAKAGRTWRGGNDLFNSISTIEDLGNHLVKIHYSSKASSVSEGLVVQMRPPVRDQTGLLIWKSQNVLMDAVNIRFFHGFALEGMHSKDLTFRNMDFRTDKSTGRISSGTADHIHMSTCGGLITVENCRFNDPHDDPINIHGTYNQVTQILASNKIKVTFKHHETAGFPNFFEGDKLGFTRQDNMIPIEEEFTVTHVDGPDGLGGNMGEGSGSLTDMILTLDHDLPADVKVNEYAVENLSYVPDVIIRGNEFIESPTRGVLCTTSGKVIIENNRFESMNQAGLYLSNDAQTWYESGPIRDMVIRGNIFIHNQSYPILIEPTNPTVDPDKPVHHNITIENNTFYTQGQTVISAKSTEGLTIQNNRILRDAPINSFELQAEQTELMAGQSLALKTSYQPYSSGSQIFALRGCSNVLIAGNTYDTGLTRTVSLSSTSRDSVTIENDEAVIGSSSVVSTQAEISYTSSDPSVISVDASGVVTAHKPGQAVIQAAAVNGDHIFGSNPVVLNVKAASSAAAPESIAVDVEKNVIRIGESLQLQTTLAGPQDMDETLRYQAYNAASGVVEACIDEQGLFSTEKEGVYVLSAMTISGLSDRAVVVVQADAYGMNDGFSLEAAASPDTVRFTETGVEMDFVHGGLWETQKAANILAFNGLEDYDHAEVTVHEEGKASEHYSDIVLAFMKDEDNYVAVERKLRGSAQKAAVVREENCSGRELWMETGNESSSPLINEESSDLKLVKDGDTITGYLCTDGTAWRQVAQCSASFLNSGFKVALLVLDSYGPTKTTTVSFSDLQINGQSVALSKKVGDPALTSASIVYDEEADTASIAYEGAKKALTFWMLAKEGEDQAKLISSAPSDTLTCTPDMKNGQLSALVVPMASNTHGGVPAASEPITITGQGKEEAGIKPVSDAYLKEASITGLANAISFNRNTLNYLTLASCDEQEIGIRIEADDPKAEVLYDFNDVKSNVCPETVRLHAGQNILKVRVTAQDKETIRDYRFVIFRTGDSNTDLSSLVIDGKEYGNPDEDTLSIKMDEIRDLDITAIAASSLTEVSVFQNGKPAENGMLHVLPGINQAVVVIDPETSAPARYLRVTIQTPDPALADLASASFTDNISTPSFETDAETYSGQASSSLSGVSFASIEDDASLILSLNGRTLMQSTGVLETKVELEEGENVLQLLCVSPDQSASRLYSWNILGKGALYLSDLDWTSATTGYAAAPARKDLSSDGNPIRLYDGEKVLEFAKGLSTHAPGEIVYNLDGLNASTFEAWLGLDREVYNTTYKPHVRLEVYADGVKVYETAQLYHDSAAEKVTLDVTGVSNLRLAGAVYENNYSAHCDFGDAFVTVPFKSEQVSVAVTADSARGTAFADREDGLYQIGAYANLTASASEGFVFAGWKDAEGQIISTANPLRLEVTGPAVLEAVFEEGQQPAVKADKTLLAMAYAKGAELAAFDAMNHVNELVRAYFESSMQQANAVLENENASQQQVNEAWADLCKAIHMLGFTTDKSALAELTAKAQALDPAAFEEKGWQALQDAIIYAQSVLDDPAALDDVSIAKAIADLQAAIDALVPVSEDLDTTLLALLVDECSKADLEAYLPDGQDAFVQALQYGKEVLAAPQSQSEIDEALSSLHTAWLNLRRKPDEALLAALRSTLAKAEAFDISVLSAESQKVFIDARTALKNGLNNPGLDQNQAEGIAPHAKVLTDLMSQKTAQAPAASASAVVSQSSHSASVKTAAASHKMAYGLMMAAAAFGLLAGLKRKK